MQTGPAGFSHSIPGDTPHARIPCQQPIRRAPGHVDRHCAGGLGAGAGGAGDCCADRAQHPCPGGGQRGRHGAERGAVAGRGRQHQPRAGAADHEGLSALLRGRHAARRSLGRAAQLRRAGQRGLRLGRQIRQRNGRHCHRVRQEGRRFHPHHHLGQERQGRAPDGHAAWPHRPGLRHGVQGRALYGRHGGERQALHGPLPARQGRLGQGHCAAVHRQ